MYADVFLAIRGHRDLAGRLGMHLMQEAIYWDLELLRQYGNWSSHAHYFLTGYRMGPEPRVVVAVMRVVMSFAVWRLRLSKL